MNAYRLSPERLELFLYKFERGLEASKCAAQIKLSQTQSHAALLSKIRHRQPYGPPAAHQHHTMPSGYIRSVPPPPYPPRQPGDNGISGNNFDNSAALLIKLEKELSLALEFHNLYTERLHRVGELKSELATIRMGRRAPMRGVPSVHRLRAPKSRSIHDLTTAVPDNITPTAPSQASRLRKLHASSSALSQFAAEQQQPSTSSPSHNPPNNKSRQLSKLPARHHRSELCLSPSPQRKNSSNTRGSSVPATARPPPKARSMSAIEGEIADMVGRFHFEVRAIAGYARITSGDVFEVSVRHGNQRWKTRGKTQPDRTQRWTDNTVTFNCVADAPVVLKVVEVHFFRSRCLNECQFDPVKFLSHQPQLVTMSLNNTGSMKLQLIVTWIPLLTSKGPPLPNGHARHFMADDNNRRSAIDYAPPREQHQAAYYRRSNQVDQRDEWAPSEQEAGADEADGSGNGAMARRQATSTKPAPLTGSKSMYVPPTRLNGNVGNANEGGGSLRQPMERGNSMAVADSITPKFCLRDKKKRQSGVTADDKARWRSSTTILDSVYKDISKSILTIDDLSGMATPSRGEGANQRHVMTLKHKTMLSEGNEPSPTANGPAPRQPRMGNPSQSTLLPSSTTPKPTLTPPLSLRAPSYGGAAEDGKMCAGSSDATSSATSMNGTLVGSNGGRSKSSPPPLPAHHQLAAQPPPSTTSGTHTMAGEARGKTRLSSLKKNRVNREASLSSSTSSYSSPALAGDFPSPAIDANGRFPAMQGVMSASYHHPSPAAMAGNGPHSTFDEDHPSRSASLRYRRQSYHVHSGAIQLIDSLLKLIDRLRAALRQLQQAEVDYAELSAFEACMLNWEAVLKLNRAAHIEENRLLLAAGGLGGSLALRSRVPAAGSRNSLYTQHSPSTASDETNEENGGLMAHAVHAGGADQISENDSGIDSLRGRRASPQSGGSSSGGHGSVRRQVEAAASSNGGSGSFLRSTGTGAAQRRFNKLFRERRKSLGAMFDALIPAASNWAATPGGSGGPSSAQLVHGEDMANGDELAFCKPPLKEASATGHVEVDHCLQQHLHRAEGSLKTIVAKQDSPFGCTLSEMLSRMEQDTLALEALLVLADSLLEPIDVQKVMTQLGAEKQVQELWLGATQEEGTDPQHQAKSLLVVEEERLRQQFLRHLMPIVGERYPTLVGTVLNNLMDSLCRAGGWESMLVSIFQFGHLFHDKHLHAFVENLAHEAWINTSLASGDLAAVREVTFRLRQVPVVPPLGSLRHMALVLAKASPSNAPAQQLIEKYLRGASPELAADLLASFISLLDHEDEHSRHGACRALVMLKNEQALESLDYLAARDQCSHVRLEARRASNQIRRYFYDFQEITKI